MIFFHVGMAWWSSHVETWGLWQPSHDRHSTDDTCLATSLYSQKHVSATIIDTLNLSMNTIHVFTNYMWTVTYVQLASRICDTNHMYIRNTCPADPARVIFDQGLQDTFPPLSYYWSQHYWRWDFRGHGDFVDWSNSPSNFKVRALTITHRGCDLLSPPLG